MTLNSNLRADRKSIKHINKADITCRLRQTCIEKYNDHTGIMHQIYFHISFKKSYLLTLVKEKQQNQKIEISKLR